MRRTTAFPTSPRPALTTDTTADAFIGARPELRAGSEISHESGELITADHLLAALPARGSVTPEPSDFSIGLRDLPVEMLSSIAAELDDEDLKALLAADPTLFLPLRSEVRALHMKNSAAPGVRTLAEFMTLLGHDWRQDRLNTSVLLDHSIQGLHASLRRKPLAALAGRILALPPEDRQQAIDAILHFVDTPGSLRGPAPPLLRELVEACRVGPGRLVQREEALTRPGGPARAAVMAGKNMQDVARDLGLSGPGAVALEDWAAAGLAAPAIRRGEALASVMERFGFVTPRAIFHLRMQAAETGIREGMSCTLAARRCGIQGLRAIGRLETYATANPARAAVRRGAPVPDVVLQYGITTPARVDELKEYAVEAEIENGANLGHVLRRYGITDPARIVRLERHSVHGRGRREIEDGGQPCVVAERLGLESPESIAALMDYAAQGAVGRGLNVGEARERFGVVDPGRVDRLEELSAAGPARSRIAGGERAPVVARQLGITSPARLRELMMYEASLQSNRCN